MLKYSLIFLITGNVLAQGPIIKTSTGKLKGTIETSDFSFTFYSFKGIPYAEPPIGNLRFRNPVPHKGWSGVRDASKHGNFCPNFGINGIGAGGEEDCLFLNVYTPSLKSNLPVMFWIHGGAFVIGDGNSLVYGPDLLLRENIVVVTLNYRLSSLGFLSTGDKNAQGNYGLKDMVLALKWVKNNIAAFGGNPTQVTVIGQSAGSVAIHLMLMSEMSRELFNQTIMMSGTAIAPFASQKNVRARAEEIGRKLNLSFNSTESLMRQLRQIDYKRILKEERGIFSMESPLGLRPFDFTPCVEPTDSTEEIFLSDEPIKLLTQRKYRTVSTIIGTTSKEGLIMVRQYMLDNTIFDEYNEDDSFLVPLSFELPRNSSHVPTVAKAFREIYFDGGNLSKGKLNGWASYHTDAQFKFPTERTIKFMAETSTSPIFYYNFSYIGSLNFLKSLLFLKNYDGVCHTDDVFYLFAQNFPIPTWPNDHALIVKRRLVRLFTNFAKFGNPTPKIDDLVKAVWPKYTTADEFVMDIGQELKVQTSQGKLKQWHDFQKQFTGHM